MKKSYVKYANIYDLDGTLINHVKEDGRLHDLTIEEVEAIVDRLGEDKDEDGKIRRKTEFDNACAVLFHMYNKYGNPHEKDIIEAVKNAAKQKASTEEIKEKLEEVNNELEDGSEYVEYEEAA